MEQFEEARSTTSNLSLVAKRFLCLIGLLAAINVLNAQDSYSKKLSMGIEFGPNLTTFYGESSSSQKTMPAIGFSSGITFQVYISKHFSFRTSYLFERKVEKTKEKWPPIDTHLKSEGDGNEYSNFDYITIPILFQYEIGNQVYFFTNAGPFIGFLINGKRTKEMPALQIMTSYPTTNNYDFGVAFGLGIGITLKKKLTLKFEARNNLSLVPVYVNNDKSKINTVGFLLGISYNYP